MLAVDKPRALRTIAMWAEFLTTGAGRRNHIEFHDLDQFMQYRVLDVGKMYWVGVLTFGMAIDIPDHEMDLCSELCHAAWLSCGLINDLYSWPKERKAAVDSGASHVNNAVWVLMRQHGIDEPAAIARLKDRIRSCMAQHLVVVEQCKHRTNISLQLRRFVEAMEYSMVANVVFSGECPRYNYQRGFNERQLGWMKGGTPSEPGIMGRAETQERMVCRSEGWL
ncbi:isoprenoid synthase domain-containing protein [Cercophora newfieldiana]|uniref:Isoprenoid synthase domain-containing protein n=1 Tax=Cercophora newfieldiana TaxID=92897 RepID=A0AA39XR23_9PEZI|nr:isoprenoid synthase domain-containing protein [Cercophora newfieldiana]